MEGLQKRKPTELLPIKALPDRKQGRPLLLGDELDTAVQAYVESIQKLGGVVNTAIVLGSAEAIIADRKHCSRATSHSKNTSVRASHWMCKNLNAYAKCQSTNCKMLVFE